MAGYQGPLGTSYAGAAPPLQDRRKYDLSDKIIERFISAAPLYGILSNKMKKKLVGDPEFKHWEDAETTFTATLEGCDAAGSDAALTTSLVTVKIAGAEDFLQVGMYLHVPQNQTNQTTAAGTVRLTGENMKIAAIDAALDKVTVVRDTNTAGNVAAGSGNHLTFYILPSPNQEGSTAPDAMQDALGVGQQYCKIYRRAVDVTGTRMATDMYAGSDLQRQRTKAFDFTVRAVERDFFHSILARDSVNGKYRRTMRGLLDWMWTPTDSPADPDTAVAVYSSTTDLVTGTGTSRIYNVGGTLTLLNWYRFLEKAFMWGSSRKIGFCGSTFLSEFQYMLSNKVQMPPQKQRWGLEVYDFAAPAGVLTMVHEPALLGGYSSDCVVLDLDPLGYAYTAAEPGSKYSGSRDIRLIKDIGENSYDGTKEEVFAEVAIKLAFLKAHSWITGITATA